MTRTPILDSSLRSATIPQHLLCQALRGLQWTGQPAPTPWRPPPQHVVPEKLGEREHHSQLCPLSPGLLPRAIGSAVAVGGVKEDGERRALGWHLAHVPGCSRNPAVGTGHLLGSCCHTQGSAPLRGNTAAPWWPRHSSPAAVPTASQPGRRGETGCDPVFPRPGTNPSGCRCAWDGEERAGRVSWEPILRSGQPGTTLSRETRLHSFQLRAGLRGASQGREREGCAYEFGAPQCRRGRWELCLCRVNCMGPEASGVSCLVPAGRRVQLGWGACRPSGFLRVCSGQLFLFLTRQGSASGEGG